MNESWHPRRSWARAAAPLVLAVLSARCASAPLRLPSGPGSPAAQWQEASAQAFAACRGVRTWSAELAVSGRVDGERLRGRLLAGFERGGRMRLEGLAPFGAPVFVLAAAGRSATLLLTRERRVVERADPAAVLEAAAGIALEPDDLLGALTGCVAGNTDVLRAVSFDGGWMGVELAGSATAYLRRTQGRWQVAAGRLGPVTVEYEAWGAASPSRLRLRVSGAGGRETAGLSVRVESPDINVSIPQAAFEIRVPPGTDPITLDEIRRAGPVAGREGR